MTKASKKTGRKRAAEASRPIHVSSTSEDGEGGASEAKKPAVSPKKAKGKLGQPGSKNPHRRCTRIKANGEQCKMAAIKGGTVCITHGGNAPAIRAAAAQVLEDGKRALLEMQTPALKQLRAIVEQTGTSDADRLKAINAVLNRTGLSERHMLDVVPRPETPWDKLGESGIDLDPDLSSLPITAPTHSVGGGDDPNRVQLQNSAQDDVDRERHDEEAAEYTARPRFNHGDVIQGEVVDTTPRNKGPEDHWDGPLTPPDPTNDRSEHDPAPKRGRYDIPADRASDAPPRYVDEELREAHRVNTRYTR